MALVAVCPSFYGSTELKASSMYSHSFAFLKRLAAFVHKLRCTQLIMHWPEVEQWAIMGGGGPRIRKHVIRALVAATVIPAVLPCALGGRSMPIDKTSFHQTVLRPIYRLRITSLFWGPKKMVPSADMDFSLGDFCLKESGTQGSHANSAVPRKISVSVISSISEVQSKDWDACALDACGAGKYNPFISHGFLTSLEEAGCSVEETGWLPRHIIAKDEFNNVLGVVPLYLKSHSYGEYVFDHSWADAHYSYGSRYYPKLQCCIPFTPVTGQRILTRNASYSDEVFNILVSSLKELTVKLQVSSLHVTFPSEYEWGGLKDKGFLQRIGMQYHWRNRNYQSFDEFLMDLKQPKRKNIRQERKKISAQNLSLKRLRGYEIKAEHWDSFYGFYRNTTDNKFSGEELT